MGGSLDCTKMGKEFAVVLVAFCVVSVAQTKLGAPGGPMKLQYDVLDSFKVISSWESAVSVADSDDDSMFDCLKATRTKIDYDAQTAKFMWTFYESANSPRKEVTFLVRPGPRPGTMEMTSGNDPKVSEGIFYFMNDECLVMDLEYHGHQCLLWTRKESKDKVPKECFERFVDVCGEHFRQNRRQSCPDD